MTAGESREPAWTLGDTTGARVGDPVPAGGAGNCPAVSSDPAWPWLCTADAGHAGPHVAGGSSHVHAVWTDAEVSA